MSPQRALPLIGRLVFFFFCPPQTDDWFPGLLIDWCLPFSHYSFLHKAGPAVCAGVGSMREVMRYSNERAHINDRSGAGS